MGPYKYYHYYNSLILGIPASQTPGSPDHLPNRHCPPNPKKNYLISPCNLSLLLRQEKKPKSLFYIFHITSSGLTDELELAGTSTISARGQRKPALAKSSPKNSSSGCHHKSLSGRSRTSNLHKAHPERTETHTSKSPQNSLIFSSSYQNYRRRVYVCVCVSVF